ncbi:hypothetical protein HNY73_007007 [Argiope bruennichi]|uniref:Uncharacterized protein n=1 Tax=Argiope bruennichi TaxID=94029 RepID=A0A8T0FF24_ARGBR|nr:hypothetical protein HNY73_007007 [Argiope bruennichi]
MEDAIWVNYRGNSFRPKNWGKTRFSQKGAFLPGAATQDPDLWLTGPAGPFSTLLLGGGAQFGSVSGQTSALKPIYWGTSPSGAKMERLGLISKFQSPFPKINIEKFLKGGIPTISPPWDREPLSLGHTLGSTEKTSPECITSPLSMPAGSTLSYVKHSLGAFYAGVLMQAKFYHWDPPSVSILNGVSMRGARGLASVKPAGTSDFFQ